jgi:hypothetical protein
MVVPDAGVGPPLFEVGGGVAARWHGFVGCALIAGG